jgi:hypothetical protein
MVSRRTVLKLLEVSGVREVSLASPSDKDLEERVRDLVELSYSLEVGDRARVYAELYDHLDSIGREIPGEWQYYFLDRLSADYRLSGGPDAVEEKPKTQQIVVREEELPF